MGNQLGPDLYKLDTASDTMTTITISGRRNSAVVIHSTFVVMLPWGNNPDADQNIAIIDTRTDTISYQSILTETAVDSNGNNVNIKFNSNNLWRPPVVVGESIYPNPWGAKSVSKLEIH